MSSSTVTAISSTGGMSNSLATSVPARRSSHNAPGPISGSSATNHQNRYSGWHGKYVHFVLFQFYPQWRTLRFLFNYLRDGNEEKFNKAKDEFDINLGSIEPFMESAYQVSLSI